MHQRIVGRTPWSARVPLDPLFAQPNQPHTIPERLAREEAEAPAHPWSVKWIVS
jgi:hypothetical protein